MMRTRRTAFIAVLVLVSVGFAQAQSTVASKTRTHVELLASDRFEGREAGSRGERLAADYIAAELERAGARPLPGRADMFAPFEFTAGSRDGGSQLTLTRSGEAPQLFSTRTQIQALSFSDDAELSGPVVFAGYGLVVPESQNFGYDSYAALDVEDKIVLVLRYFPEDTHQQTRGILARYAALRYKALAARQRGAKALLVVTGPRSPNAGELIPMSFDTALAGSGIPAASISREVADALFARTEPLEAAQEALDSGNPHVPGFDLPGVTVTLKTAVVRERQTARNVIAYLPATSPVVAPDGPWIAVGAHYDHLGRGGKGNSLAATDERTAIHHGADDNASGTAAVLALAQTLAGEARQRHVIFALWSAEEIGLVGSGTFTADAPVPLDQVAAYLNFDMVGRMQDNKLIVQATGTSPVWTPAAGARQRAGGIRPRRAARPVPADRRGDVQPGRHPQFVLHNWRARRLSQAFRHGGQDQLRGSRSNRRHRGNDSARGKRR